jgi:hypothetical protein
LNSKVVTEEAVAQGSPGNVLVLTVEAGRLIEAREDGHALRHAGAGNLFTGTGLVDDELA